MVPLAIATFSLFCLPMEPPVALPDAAMRTTDVMAFMQMQNLLSDDVLELGFTVQVCHDHIRHINDHLVLHEFSCGIFCSVFTHTSCNGACNKPAGCLATSHRKTKAKGLQSVQYPNRYLDQGLHNAADEFWDDLNASMTALKRAFD